MRKKNQKKYHVQLLKRNELLTHRSSAVNICQLISGLLITSYSKTILQLLASKKPFSYSLPTEKLLFCCGKPASAHPCYLEASVLDSDSLLTGVAQTQSKKMISASIVHERIILTQIILCLQIMVKGCILFCFPWRWAKTGIPLSCRFKIKLQKASTPLHLYLAQDLG